jgi:hypothetical protein
MTKDELVEKLVEKVTLKYQDVKVDSELWKEFKEIHNHLEILEKYEVDEYTTIKKIGIKFPNFEANYYKEHKPYLDIDVYGLAYLQLGYLFNYIEEDIFIETLLKHIEW